MSEEVTVDRTVYPLQFIGLARINVPSKEDAANMVAVLLVNDTGFFPLMPEKAGLAEIQRALASLLGAITNRQAEMQADEAASAGG